MKCESCRFAPPSDPEGFNDECGCYDKYGTVWKDGSYGCTLNYQTLQKWEKQRLNDLGYSGEDMGVQMDFDNQGWSMEAVLDDMRHMIGLDMFKHKPYKRHGKLFYRPFRNYWAGPNKYLDYFSGAIGIAVRLEPEARGRLPYYYLTRRGLDFLGRHIGVTIHDKRD